MTPERTRELLENCAKACGIEVTDAMRKLWMFEGSSAWNPFTSSADYSEMEAKLRLNVWWHDDATCVEVGAEGLTAIEDYCNHPTPQLARMFAGCRAAEILYFQSLTTD